MPERENIPSDEGEESEEPLNRFRRLVAGGEEWEESLRQEGEAHLDEPSSDESTTKRHPTGIPEATGGWYAEIESDEVTDSSADIESPVIPEEGITGGDQEITSPAPDATADVAQETQEPSPSQETIPPSQAYKSDTPPPPPLGTTPQRKIPALDEHGMPLPRRVDEIDVDATRVSPSAYASTRAARSKLQPSKLTSAPPSTPIAPPMAPQAGGAGGRRTLGCLLRLAIVAVFLGIMIALVAGTFVFFQYYQIAATLPDVDDLSGRASQFETTRILDRNGDLLYEIIDPNAGRRTYVPLERISPFLIAATIATEDKNYYSHPGFDSMAILRAFLQNYQSGETVSGASTITQQLARTLLFSPDERGQRTYMRKVREALLAEEITRRYSKEEILELYLNEIYYGNIAYGVEAAAQTYFNSSANKLTMGQAAFLAGLAQAPSVYDIYTNRDVTMTRMQQVLVLMYQASQEQNCIFVSTNQIKVCVSTADVGIALNEIEAFDFDTPDIQIRYPHWVVFIQKQLESQFDPQTIYRSGFTVHTTLDPVLQDAAQQIVQEKIEGLVENNAGNGALVAMNPKNGEILAMVGSADYYNEEIDGQVNMALAPRQPGSSIKPINYVAAFEKGWTPATLIWDVPSEFPPSGDPNDPRPPYKPVNYDERFHGPVTVRSALANSYNVPAVKTLQFVGIYDDPQTPDRDGMIAMAERLGITTLTRNDYGMSLTLGGGEVPLLEMVGAYAVFATGGQRIPPFAITRIEDNLGEVVFEHQPPNREQVIRPEHAFLISSILSDNVARTPAFGSNSVLNLPFQAAGKTGTTNDFRDNWTLGYTTDIVAGVWVGNADNTPMVNTSGLTGAAPIWAEFMQFAVQYLAKGPSFFTPPAGITEKVICSVSGAEPSEYCSDQTTEFFAIDQPPLSGDDDLWKDVLLDTWTGLRASDFCDDFTKAEVAINVTDPWAIKWIEETSQGRDWAEEHDFDEPFIFIPERDCREDDPHPIIEFSDPRDGSTIITTTVDIVAQVDATGGFDRFRVEYGEGNKPKDWETIDEHNQPFPNPGVVATWELDPYYPPGPLWLRIFLERRNGAFAERRIRVNINIPTPTPTPTETPTETPTPTPTFTPTLTPTYTPTSTPITPSPTPTNTQVFIPPTVTPSPPVQTPTNTSVPSP